MHKKCNIHVCTYTYIYIWATRVTRDGIYIHVCVCMEIVVKRNLRS